MRKLRRFLFSVLKGAVIVYAMVVGILWFMQDTMLYHRSDGAPMLNDPALLPKREIVCLTTADGLNLRSWYFKPARAELPTVVFFHGNAGDIGNHLPFAKFLIEAGYGNVNLVEQTDPSLLGGLVLKIGARLYDTSLKSRLQRLQYAMKGAA